MTSKVILYTLEKDGTIPTYVLNGGYFAVANNLNPPQDWNILGIGDSSISQDNLPENCLRVFSERDELEEYISSISPSETIQIIDGEEVLSPITPEYITDIVDFILALEE